ncbi:riboflavin synthase [Streptomyces sp. G1]|uniref:riboflavin synthase n=1 Tax=Streptomyces sp. G1 TaxID=361572 RepID=UPI002030B676|nr:riboflavin synthase [Streptomyces sp. G1]MCM1975794.1 riboflavin synthase [Streptomyces sp. G1]
MDRIGVVDTMFARVDMGSIAENRLAGMEGFGERFKAVRRTVPGIRDLAVACRQLIERENCEVVLACGMPGGDDLDRIRAHEASQGIMMAQVLAGKHVLEAFVHAQEEPDPVKVTELCRQRVGAHAVNAYWLLYAPEELRKRAGQGVRQGGPDAGPLPG